MGSKARKGGLIAAAAAVAVACAATGAGASELSGKTTLQQTITGDPAANFGFLSAAPGEAHLLRPELGLLKPDREKRRRSLIYFGQLSDFQLADEESPTRVEFFDNEPTVRFSNSGHRPQEALLPHEVDAMVRQVNALGQSVVPQDDGTRAAMTNVILTGDLADSMQKNETEWVMTLLEGGNLDPNSGTAANPLCAPPLTDAPAGYTGVQDYDDYVESNLFYDPDSPAGQFAAWPTYTGLQDRAQAPFTAAGLNVPSYVAVGNHDVLVQGNEDANVGYEALATGCLKPMGPFPVIDPTVEGFENLLNPGFVTGLLGTDPTKVALVPSDANRRYVDNAEQRAIYAGGAQADDHGFGYVDPAQLAASGGTARYYSFSPKPGIRMIAIDTNTSGAGLLIDPTTGADTSSGNIDDPQFQWLKAELAKAEAADELVITFAHHASTSMNFTLPDELASPCAVSDAHGHDVNPGCDRDPRPSTPIHTQKDFVALLNDNPQVIAHVAGHSHENEVIPHAAPGGGWWEIKTPAIADWPSQSRLIDVMDNKDGTLSIFGTLIDHDSPISSPTSGSQAASSPETLASLGRTISFTDFQAGGTTSAAGGPEDRNVELLLFDPRRSAGGGGGGPPGFGCRNELRGGKKGDRLTGTDRDDVIFGLRGKDRISGGRGNDCISSGRGRDRVFGGPDNDLIKGGGGNDRLKGDLGTDLIRGGAGNDRVRARDGVRDIVKCGKGRDFATADKVDRVKGCERTKRR